MRLHVLERVLSGRRHGYFRCWFIFMTIAFIFFALSRRPITEQHDRTSYVYSPVASFSRNESRYDRYCTELNRSIALERRPTFTVEISPSNSNIPYFYSQWKSSKLMPRLISTCDHALTMYLLSLLIDHVFHKYNIPYMMMAATLLGM